MITNEKSKDIKSIENLTTVPELSINYKATAISKKPLTTGEDLADFLRLFFDSGTFNFQEEFLLLLMNGDSIPLGVIKLHKGNRGTTPSDHHLILSILLKHGIDNFVVAHNHPAGDWTPSEADLNFTISMVHQARYFEINLQDHIVLTQEGFYSFDESTFLLN